MAKPIDLSDRPSFLFRLWILACCLVLLLQLSCSRSNYHVDYNTNEDYTFRSFGWLDSSIDDPGLDAPREQLLQSKLTKKLQDKGLLMMDGSPDLLLTYYTGNKAVINPKSRGYAYWPSQWARGGYGGDAAMYAFKKGTLIVDIIEQDSHQLLWRGSARNAFRGNDAKLVENLDEALNEIFRYFPPPALKAQEGD